MPRTVGGKVVTNKKLKAESPLDMYYGSLQSPPAAEVDTGKWWDHTIWLIPKSTEKRILLLVQS